MLLHYTIMLSFCCCFFFFASWGLLSVICSLSCQAHWHFPEEETDFLLVQEVIRVARSLRAQCGLVKEKPVSKSAAQK